MPVWNPNAINYDFGVEYMDDGTIGGYWMGV